MVVNSFRRLGVVGAILIASVFLFGVMAGAVVIHRLQASPSATVGQQQGEGHDQGQPKDASGQEAGEGPENETGQGQSRQASGARTNPSSGAENSQNED